MDDMLHSNEIISMRWIMSINRADGIILLITFTEVMR